MRLGRVPRRVPTPLVPVLAAGRHVYAPEQFMFRQHVGTPELTGGCLHTVRYNPSRWLTTPSLDLPIVILVTPYEVVRELRTSGSPYFFGTNVDPATGIDGCLLEAVRGAAHPVDLLRRLGRWADDVQKAVPPGMLATCWHPAVTADVLRQASRYPVRAVHARTTEEAAAAAGPLLAEALLAGGEPWQVGVAGRVPA